MEKQRIEDFLFDQINQHKARRQRIQNAINCLNYPEDKDLLEGLLVGRAYLTGAITEMELVLFAYC